MPKKLAITISPPPRHTACRFIEPLKNYYLDDTFYIKYILNKYNIKKYLIYPEIDPKGRLHYHGIIDISNTHDEVTMYKVIQFKLKKDRIYRH